jgi:hypothetical protein
MRDFLAGFRRLGHDELRTLAQFCGGVAALVLIVLALSGSLPFMPQLRLALGLGRTQAAAVGALGYTPYWQTAAGNGISAYPPSWNCMTNWNGYPSPNNISVIDDPGVSGACYSVPACDSGSSVVNPYFPAGTNLARIGVLSLTTASAGVSGFVTAGNQMSSYGALGVLSGASAQLDYSCLNAQTAYHVVANSNSCSQAATPGTYFTGANAVTITDPAGRTVYSGSAVQGSLRVNITAAGNYTLACKRTSDNTTWTAAAPVTLSTATLSLTANPQNVGVGWSSTLVRSVSGAQLGSCSIKDQNNNVVASNLSDGGTPQTVYLTSGSTWTVPSDWNSGSYTIEVIGGGGGGSGAAGGNAGGGGGGGAYSKVVNVSLTPGSSVAYSVGSAGSAGSTGNGGAGGDTYFCNSISNCASISGTAVVAGAKGGTGGVVGDHAGSSGGLASSGIGTTKYSGGNGGPTNGGQSSPAYNYPGGGGGGAAGPSGNGKNGGSGCNGSAGYPCGGGGGGGADNGSAGTNGANGSVYGGGNNAGGAGGNNNSGVGGGSGGTPSGGAGGAASGAGAGGGGSAGSTSSVGAAGAGAAGAEWDGSHGAGGGGGGGGGSYGGAGGAGAAGALYGGGGGAGAYGTGGSSAGGAGAQGVIVIRYSGSSSNTTSVGPLSQSTTYTLACTDLNNNAVSTSTTVSVLAQCQNGQGPYGYCTACASGYMPQGTSPVANKIYLTATSTTVADDSGAGNTGTSVNGPLAVAGAMGNALSFNGANQYVDAGTPASGQSTVSFSLWVKANRIGTSAGGGYSVAPVYQTGGNGGWWIEWRGSGSLELGTFVGTTYTPFTIATLTDTSSWHIITGSITAGGAVTAYLDGALKVSSTISSGWRNSSAHLLIGTGNTGANNPSNYSQYFSGSVDDVRIYNRALSAAEVSTLAAKGDVASGLAGKWSFDSYGTSSWTVPYGWDSGNNTIEVIGGGGGGGAGTSGAQGASGGGGGAYSKVTNVSLTPGSTITYAVGLGGAGGLSSGYNGNTGGDTYICNSASNCFIGGSAVVTGAKGGGGGVPTPSTGVGSGGAALGGVGATKYSGGNGTANSTNAGGGGGGAAGPLGAGANGGTGVNGGGGGGGGGNGGGSSGSNASGNTGGAGGNNNGAAGGGPANLGGSSGGGGGGSSASGTAGAGGAGLEWDTSHGSGGGGGSGAAWLSGSYYANGGAAGGLYGGGGGGGGAIGPSGPWGTGGAGGQGVIVLSYTPTVGAMCVAAQPPVLSVTATPSSIPGGQNSQIAWSSGNVYAGSCGLSQLTQANLLSAFSSIGAGDNNTAGKTTAYLGHAGSFVYKFSCVAPYLAGSGNNGTLQGSPTTGVAGKLGQAVTFGGTSDVLALASSISLSSGTWTIAAWFNTPLPVTSSGWRTLTRGATADHQVIVDATGLLGTYDNTGGTGFHSSGYNVSSLPAGWHHMAAVGSGSATTFYIDGASAGVANSESTSQVSYIGNYQGGGQQFGTIDDVRIYNRALSSDEVSTLYNGGPVTSGLVGYWPFDTYTIFGTTVFEVSGGITTQSATVSVTSSAPPTGVTLTASASHVRKGNAATLNWTVNGMASGISCYITPAPQGVPTSGLINSLWDGSTNPWANSTALTAPITAPTLYTLACGNGISTSTASAVVGLLPTFQEI